MKNLLILALCLGFYACADPTAPAETIKTTNYNLNTSDYSLLSPGYFSSVQDCPSITDNIMKNGSVSVFYQPINQDFYLQLPQTITENRYIYNWNYAIKIGKIHFFTKTNDPSNSLPFYSTGTFHVIIFKEN